MSAFKQKLARFGATAGVLAASTAAIMAVGGATASSAMAAECTGEAIHGEGSSLQREAQTIWTGTGAKAFDGTEGACPGGPAVTYEVTSSGTALKEWGVGSGSLGTNGVKDNFIGVDDAPTSSQITEINNALHAHTSPANTTNTVVIPATQTSIAVVVNLPSGCGLTKISNAKLEEAFRGSAKQWWEIGATPKASCEVAIKRVVRKDASGTTYQFKNYLDIAHTTSVCTTELGNVTWAELQNESEVTVGVTKFTPNLIWPDCTGATTIVRPEATGGGAVVKTVGKTDGSIGYAALPDAEASGNQEGEGSTILSVENGEESGEKTFALPNATGSVANCAGIKYNLPEGASSWEEAGTKANLDWSKVYGANPTVGGTKYPLCTLTWDLAATNSSAVWTAAKEKTIKSYLTYEITKLQGQAAIVGKWYAALPNSTAGTSSNPQLAAEKAVLQIS